MGGGAGAVSFHPGYVCFINELAERQTLAVETVQRVTALGHVAQHLLTSFSRIAWPQRAHFPAGEPAVASEARVVGTYAGGLHAQCEAAEAAVVNLKGL